MKIGKREYIVGISVAALAAIAVIHIFIFEPRAKQYREASAKFDENMALLKSVPEPRSPNQIKRYQDETGELNSGVTSVVEELRLDMPAFYIRRAPEFVEQRIDVTMGLLRRIVELRDQQAQRRTPPQLTFLDDRRRDRTNAFEPNQGWNLPSQLPEQRSGALWDNVSKLKDNWVLTNAITQPIERLQQRRAYNELLVTIGIIPAEISDWVAPVQVGYQWDYVFFNGIEQAEALLNSRVLNNVQSFEQLRNPYSTNRFGVMVPSLKKLWVAELIYGRKDPSTQMTRDELRQILEVNLDTGHALLATNKELEALVDITQRAIDNQIAEIRRVNLLRAFALTKYKGRVQESTATETAATPTPAAMPAEAMGMETFGEAGMMYGTVAMATPIPEEEKIGGGAGLEIWFVANNTNMVQFLFDISNAPRSYAIDDLDITVQADRTLLTSCTVELVTNLEGQ